jgi:diacylglycerol kinase family enzyme
MESVFTLTPRRTVTVHKVYLIVNPFGGKGRGRIVLKDALEEFAKHGATWETLETKHRRHAEEYARTIQLAGFDALCAIGGDGTFNEVVNGMLTREDRQRIPFGFVAGGTGNSTMVDLTCARKSALRLSAAILFRNWELNLLSPGSGCPLQVGAGHGRPGRALGRC